MQRERKNIFDKYINSFKKKFENRDFKNIWFSLLSYLIIPLATIISTPILIINLGIEKFGIWMLINSLIGILGVTNLGLGNSVVKFGSGYISEKNFTDFQKIVSFSLVVSFVIGVITSISVFYFGEILANILIGTQSLVNQENILLLQLTGIVIGIKIIGSIFSAIIMAYQRYDIVSKINIVINVSNILLITILAIFYKELVYLMYTLIFINLFSTMLFAYISLTQFLNLKFHSKISIVLMRNWITYGVFAWIQVIISTIYTQFDKILVSSILGPQALGIYSACLQLAVKIHEIFTAITAYLFPKFSSLNEQNKSESIRIVYLKASLLTLSGVLIVSSLLFVFSEVILNLWISKDFSIDNSLLLKLLIISSVSGSLFIVPFYFLNGIGKIKLNTTINFLLALINLISSYYLIPQFDLLGASLGRLLGLPIILLSILYIDIKILKVSTFKKIVGLVTSFILIISLQELVVTYKYDVKSLLHLLIASSLAMTALIFLCIRVLKNSNKSINSY